MIIIRKKLLHYYQRLPWYARHKYVLTTAFFLIWMLFFDQNDFINQYKRSRQLRSLQSQKAYYINEIERIKKDKEALFSSDESLERFAREKYFMKRDDEEIFVIRRK